VFTAYILPLHLPLPAAGGYQQYLSAAIHILLLPCKKLQNTKRPTKENSNLKYQVEGNNPNQ